MKRRTLLKILGLITIFPKKSACGLTTTNKSNLHNWIYIISVEKHNGKWEATHWFEYTEEELALVKRVDALEDRIDAGEDIQIPEIDLEIVHEFRLCSSCMLHLFAVKEDEKYATDMIKFTKDCVIDEEEMYRVVSNMTDDDVSEKSVAYKIRGIYNR